jgi:hypothetical protein
MGEHMDDATQGLIEKVLTYMSLAEKRDKLSVNANYFDGAEPMLTSEVQAGNVPDLSIHRPCVNPQCVDHQREGKFALSGAPHLARIRPEYLQRPFDYTWLSDVTKTGGGVSSQRFGLIRVRAASLQECRGKVRRIYPVMGRAATAIFNEVEGKYDTSDLYAGLDGDRWRTEHFSRDKDSDSEQQVHEMFEAGLNLQYVRQKDWKVKLAYGNFPSVAFVTDTAGVLESFRLRDMPNGRPRRAALLHWVEEHWRKNRKDEDLEIKVRSHLRGARRFVWNGLSCEVVPPVLLEDRAEQPKQPPMVRRV